MRKFIAGFGLLLLAVSLGVAFFLTMTFRTFLNTPLIPAGKNINYIFKTGSSIKVLAKDLNDLKVLDKPNFLIWLAYWKGVATHLKAGEYLFTSGIKPAALLDQMAAGKVVVHRITFVEGWTFAQMMATLNKNPLVIHHLSNLNADAILTTLGFPPNNPEGLFFPATYPLVKDTNDVVLLKKAHQAMSSLLAKEWQHRAPNLPYKNSYEALIVASLIEKETGQAAERPLVSGVILNRLQKKMRLQIDSTVIYGMGQSYTGRITRQDLQRDTPYNTYVHYGLPPTPIAMPSKQSIQAALHPLLSDNLYFVSRENGTHAFSPTLAQQNQEVATYQLNIQFPKVGKRFNTKTCIYLWYLSPMLQQLFGNHCESRLATL